MMLAPVGKTASPGFPSSGSVSDTTMDSRAGGRSGRPVALAILFNNFFLCREFRALLNEGVGANLAGGLVCIEASLERVWLIQVSGGNRWRLWCAGREGSTLAVCG